MISEKVPKKIAILGSTGSIGESSLDVIRRHPGHFRALYLTAHRNVEKLVEQTKEFRPRAVVISDPEFALQAEQLLREVCEVHSGMEGLLKIVQDPEVDLVLNALVGAVGVLPTFRAIQAGKDVALANKETLVMAGQLIMDAARRHGVRILPIDSEHSAIWQCLLGEDPASLRRIILTASGGPFRTWKKSKLREVTVEQALRHPNWQMGPKITIDSATLMNKGLEVIEAHWLYRVPPERIEVIIHPQSIIHSMVEFHDGSVKAQLGIPDMRIPIQFALTYPERLPLSLESVSFQKIGSLTFQPVEQDKFPCLEMAFQALREGGTLPAVMNMANEVAVQRFLQKEIAFTDIPVIIRKTMAAHRPRKSYTIEDLLQIEQWARQFAARV